MVGIAHAAGIVGLDISDHVLRLAMLRGGRRLRLVAAADIAVPEGTIVHGDIAKPDVAVSLVRQLQQRAGRAARAARYCVASLPEPTSFLKLLQITPSAVSDLGHDVLAEAAGHLPMSTDEAYVDWQLLSPAGGRGPATVLVAATPRQTANQYLDVLNRAGLQPVVLELEPIAIGRAVLADDAAASNGTVAVLDLGGTRASYTVFRNTVPQFTVSLPISSGEWTATVAGALQLPADQAEEAKLRCGLDNPACDGAVADALAEPLQDLARRLQEALGYYQGHLDATRPVAKTLLTGGGSQLAGLAAYLTPQLGHPVELALPLARIATRQFRLTPGQGLQYATALGLARRAMVPVQV